MATLLLPNCLGNGSEERNDPINASWPFLSLLIILVSQGRNISESLLIFLFLSLFSSILPLNRSQSHTDSVFLVEVDEFSI